MKSLICILGILLIFTVSCNAGETKKSPNISVLDEDEYGSFTKAEVICVDGYKFLVVKTPKGVSVTQMYKSFFRHARPQPIRCMNEER